MRSSDSFRNWNQTSSAFLKNRSRGSSIRVLLAQQFQGLLKDKLQFSRTKIYSLTPSSKPYWLKHLMEANEITIVRFL